MRSSDRILRSGSTPTAAPPRGAGGGPAEPATPAIPTAVGGPPVIRGVAAARRPAHGGSSATASGITARRSAAGSGSDRPSTVGWDLAEGAEPVAGAGSEAAGVDLRQAHRIAEDRGYAAGHARATAELRGAVAAAAALAERLDELAPDRTAAVAAAISAISLAVARRVIGAELRIEPTLLTNALETALATINGSPEAHVFLHPATVGPVREAWEAIHGPGYRGKRWTFEGDPSLSVGGCTLRYDHGFVDAGIDAQLDEIGRALETTLPGLWSAMSAADGLVAVDAMEDVA
jgi:flagellar biosynthesis/type III secretory pathway protein FliH